MFTEQLLESIRPGFLEPTNRFREKFDRGLARIRRDGHPCYHTNSLNDRLGALLAEHLPRLRAYVRLHMGPQLRQKESASDLVQSACREVLQRDGQPQFGGEAGFRQWLFTTALRKVRDRVDYYRAGKRNVDREAPMTDGVLAGIYAHCATPSADLDMRERIARFESAFDELDGNHREVITLARIVGLSHREIAATMGCTEAASKQLLYRALAELALALERRPD